MNDRKALSRHLGQPIATAFGSAVMLTGIVSLIANISQVVAYCEGALIALGGGSIIAGTVALSLLATIALTFCAIGRSRLDAAVGMDPAIKKWLGWGLVLVYLASLLSLLLCTVSAVATLLSSLFHEDASLSPAELGAVIFALILSLAAMTA